MKRIGILVVMFLGFLSLGGTPVEKKPEAKKEWHLAAPQKSPEEIVRLKVEALDGSIEAAATLHSLYSFYFQYQEAIFWGSIAIENAQQKVDGRNSNEDRQTIYFNLAQLLTHSPDPLLQRRARFWLKQLVAERGSYWLRAEQALHQLDSRKIDTYPFPERWPKW